MSYRFTFGQQKRPRKGLDTRHHPQDRNPAPQTRVITTSDIICRRFCITHSSQHKSANSAIFFNKTVMIPGQVFYWMIRLPAKIDTKPGSADQGNSGNCSRPVVSCNPNMRFRFCSAWPAEPFTRLSSAAIRITRPGARSAKTLIWVWFEPRT